MPKPRKYRPIEMCVCLNFQRLISNVRDGVIAKTGKQGGPEYREEIRRNLELFEMNGQKFKYFFSEKGFGGGSWFVICPKCGKPKNRLYLPNKFDDREQLYLCQDCHLLRPLCVMSGKSTTYRKIIKPLKRMQAIKEMITNRKLSTERSARLVDEYEKLEKDLKASKEYRVWKFKTEHGIKAQEDILPPDSVSEQ